MSYLLVALRLSWLVPVPVKRRQVPKQWLQLSLSLTQTLFHFYFYFHGFVLFSEYKGNVLKILENPSNS